MTTDTAILGSAIARKDDKFWIIQSPLVPFPAEDKDKIEALKKFLQLVAAYLFAQDRQAKLNRGGPGRPSKNYGTHLHIQVQTSTKDKFDLVSKEFKLSQSETLDFLLSSFDILKHDIVSKEEIAQAEDRMRLQFVGAGQ